MALAQQTLSSFWHRLPFPFGERTWCVDGTTRVPDDWAQGRQLWREEVLDLFDGHDFDYQVVLVAASGFVTDTYALFATNVVLPSMAYLYWRDRTDHKPELYINVADINRVGRRPAALRLAHGQNGAREAASTGMYKNMDILKWFLFYRFLLGVGIGAEYALSAVIMAEFASTKYRARMMAAVFLMQPLGQALAAAVGWAVLASLMLHQASLPVSVAETYSPTDADQQAALSAIDGVWRWVNGVGAIPALLAIFWRFLIPESPRYTMDVKVDPKPAYANARRQYNIETPVPTPLNPGGNVPPGQGAMGSPHTADPSKSFRTHFFEEQNWKYLFACASCWFLLDFAFYGLGINNAVQLATIYRTTSVNVTTTGVLPMATTSTVIAVGQTVTFSANTYTITEPPLTIGLPPPTTTVVGTVAATATNLTTPDYENVFDQDTDMYNELYDNAKYYMWTICVGSLVGNILLLLVIDYLPRKKALVWSFGILSILFATLSGFFKAVEFEHTHLALVIFYALCQFFFNFGPNTLIFMIPAEIFPTKFRATCHGISAAAGKLGAILILIITEHNSLFTRNPALLAKVLGPFAIAMALGALVAWVWIPDIQNGPDPNARPRALRPLILPNKSLEKLAMGRTYSIQEENQQLGFVKAFSALWWWILHGGRKRNLGTRNGEIELFEVNPAVP